MNEAGSGAFERARERARVAELVLRGRAVRTIAGRAIDADDFHSLLAMLGLDEGDDNAAALCVGLTGYVAAVAKAVGVPHEATSCEVSDTTTAYLGLVVHWRLRPDRDLMLVWDERRGWSVAMESSAGQPAVVIGLLGGDLLPGPRVVAHFVTDVVTGRLLPAPIAIAPAPVCRGELVRRLSRYAGDARG